MGALVLDSCVLIGLIEPSDAQHAHCRRAVLEARQRGDDFVVPMSVLSEVLVGAFRHGVATQRQEGIVGLFGPPRVLDEPIALSAAQFRARHRTLRLPDALVLATADITDAEVLTCDKRLALVSDRVRLVEPD